MFHLLTGFKTLLLSAALFLTLSVALVAQILFVEPMLINPDLPASPRNIEKIEHNGSKVLQFVKAEEGPEHKQLREQMNQSKMIQFVFEMRRKARRIHSQIHGKYATVDEEETPFLIYFGSQMGMGGPSVASGLRILVRDAGVRSDSLMVLAPLKYKGAVMTLQDFMDQKYLGTLIAHEFFHGIMGDLYGNKMLEMKARSYSRVGHAAHLVTDEFLAFVEGTAEGLELVSQDLFPAEVENKLIDSAELTEELREFIKGFKKRRLIHAARNHFGFRGNGKVKDGELDDIETQFKTEGMISTLFYRLLYKSDLEDSYSKVFHVMAQKKPLTFIDFLKEFVAHFPDQKKSVVRQFLENTHYMSVDPAAANLYKDYYLSKKAYKQKKIDLAAYQEKSLTWKKWREEQFQAVMDDQLALDAAIKSPYMISDEEQFYLLDLNSADDFDLTDFFEEYFMDNYSESELQNMIAKLLRKRQRGEWIVSMDSIVWPDDVEEKVAIHHELYKTQKEQEVQSRVESMTEGIYAGFHEVDHSGMHEEDSTSGFSFFQAQHFYSCSHEHHNH